LQLTFEVAVEDSERALRVLGMPRSGENRWCAIALLANNGSANENDAGPHKNAQRQLESTEAPSALLGHSPPLMPVSIAAVGTSETRERRAFSDMPLSQQAALRCNETRFQFFLVDTDHDMRFKRLGWTAADEVRTRCLVQSRSEIKIDTPAGDAWDDLESRYQAWLTDKQFAGAKR
jgi:hypothetical protein